jgi:CMP-N-acetylneuraminic acid synthetase
MSTYMKNIVIIPARGVSNDLPHKKNTMLLGGFHFGSFYRLRKKKSDIVDEICKHRRSFDQENSTRTRSSSHRSSIFLEI